MRLKKVKESRSHVHVVRVAQTSANNEVEMSPIDLILTPFAASLRQLWSSDIGD